MIFSIGCRLISIFSICCRLISIFSIGYRLISIFSIGCRLISIVSSARGVLACELLSINETKRTKLKLN